MTKEEIQALIDAKIAGQGSAVDVGGALPAILSEILNLATAPPAPPETHVLVIKNTYEGESADDALNLLEYDGAKPTIQQLSEMDICNTFVTFAPSLLPSQPKLQILGVRALEHSVEINAGYFISTDTIEGGEFAHIFISTAIGGTSIIQNAEL